MSAICDKPYSSSDKWTASFMLGLLFLLIASPFTYTITNTITKYLGLEIADPTGCPYLVGTIIHALVFILLVRILLNRDNSGCLKPYTSKDKWTVSVIGGLLFILISSPFLYEAVNSLTSSLGFSVAEKEGCPKISGLILHTLIFVIISRLLMR